MNNARSLAGHLDNRKGGYHTGRKKEEWPPVPDYRNHEIAAVADWMQAHRDNRRPLTVAAPLLTIVCGLHEQSHHLPTRARLATEIGCTIDGIDAAISTALAYAEITERHVTLEGGVAKRRSTRRVRYLDPSQELYAVWRRAKGLTIKSPPAKSAAQPAPSTSQQPRAEQIGLRFGANLLATLAS